MLGPMAIRASSARTKTYRWIGLCLAVLLVPLSAVAQDVYTEEGYDGAGVVRTIDWPQTLLEAAEAVPGEDDVRERLYRARLLPFIDTLALGYSYAIEDEQPLMSFAIDWGRGEFGILDGRRVHDGVLPEDVRMTSVELMASVYVNGRPTTRLFITVDSMALAPRPDVYPFEVFGLPWDTLFEDTPADSARAYFEAGFTLRDLEVVSIRFEAFEIDSDGRPQIVRRPRQARNEPVVIVDDVHGGIFWGIGTRRGPRLPLTGPPRRDDVGRSQGDEPGVTRGRDRQEGDDTPPDRRPDRTTGPDEGREPTSGTDDAPDVRPGDRTADAPRTKPRTRSRGDDDDDDEDEESLLPAAAAGAAAVAAVAIAGGTVGWYGNAQAPIGLTSGYVKPRGGVLLQVSVNAAVLGQAEDETEHLIARVFGFGDLFGSRIQPAVGIGAFVEEISGDPEVTPDLSVGAVANLGRVLLIGGYDPVAGGVDFGIAFNFKAPRRTSPGNGR